MSQLVACDDAEVSDRPTVDPTPTPIPEVDPPSLEALKKGPYVQLTGPDSARLRFETDIDGIYNVEIICGEEIGTFEPTRATEFVDYERNFGELFPDTEMTPDIAADLTMHSLDLQEIPFNTPVEYIITPKNANPIKGSFVIKKDVDITLGWVADTMFPFAEDVLEIIADQTPDLVIHGGDLTYDPSPFDSWNHLMKKMRSVLSQSPAHFVVGNHEFEQHNEIAAQFDRLMGGQGGADPDVRYFALHYGQIYVICLDSESAKLADDEEANLFNAESKQRQWLEAQLAAANQADDVTETIVCFHRPIFSCGKRWKGDIAERDDLHGVFTKHDVRIVLCGHEHAYQRLVVDGIQYIVDGGGGALLDSPTEGVEELNELGREEPSWLEASEESRGGTILRFGADGSVSHQRLNTDGEISDSFELAARGA